MTDGALDLATRRRCSTIVLAAPRRASSSAETRGAREGSGPSMSHSACSTYSPFTPSTMTWSPSHSGRGSRPRPIRAGLAAEGRRQLAEAPAAGLASLRSFAQHLAETIPGGQTERRPSGKRPFRSRNLLPFSASTLQVHRRSLRTPCRPPSLAQARLPCCGAVSGGPTGKPDPAPGNSPSSGSAGRTRPAIMIQRQLRRVAAEIFRESSAGNRRPSAVAQRPGANGGGPSEACRLLLIRHQAIRVVSPERPPEPRRRPRSPA